MIRPYDPSKPQPTYVVSQWEDTYGTDIIGYDRYFWEHCLETDKMRVSALSKYDRRKKHAVLMKCDNGHNVRLTPYMYFAEHRNCPICICNNDRGALNIDESIISFWNDSRYQLEDVSEFSKELFMFKCPFCGKEFKEKMVNMVNKRPKCSECNDGCKFIYKPLLDDGMIYVSRRTKE